MFQYLVLLSFVLVNSTNVIITVPQLDVKKYLGHWLLVYQAPTNVIFQGYGTCITADYGLLDNGNVNVVNTQIDKNNHRLLIKLTKIDEKILLNLEDITYQISFVYAKST